MKPGSCIARSELYAHYEDFCRRQAMKPHTPASFGKVRPSTIEYRVIIINDYRLFE